MKDEKKEPDDPIVKEWILPSISYPAVRVRGSTPKPPRNRPKVLNVNNLAAIVVDAELRENSIVVQWFNNEGDHYELQKDFQKFLLTDITLVHWGFQLTKKKCLFAADKKFITKCPLLVQKKSDRADPGRGERRPEEDDEKKQKKRQRRRK